MADVELLSERLALCEGPAWVLKKLGFEDLDFDSPQAVTLINDALFAAEVFDDARLFRFLTFCATFALGFLSALFFLNFNFFF